MSNDGKNEKPTARRRQKAREKGQVARSRDLSAGLAAVAALVAISWRAPQFAVQWREFLAATLGSAIHEEVTIERLLGWIGRASFVPSLGLALFCCWLVATTAALAQGGLVVAPVALAPSWARMNPVAKLRQLFSISGLRGLLKSLLPAAAVLYLSFSVVRRDWGALQELANENTAGIAQFALSRIFEIAWKCALALVIWAVVDYVFEWRRVENDLRMTRQEVVDEFKETEGHPMIKARIRRLQRQVRRRRMLEEVRHASVVLTNPSSFAVALAYRPEMNAPTVVAKGRNRLAGEIRQLALWHGVPVLENPPLTRALYRAVEIGQAIPPKLYTVVAEILAVLFRAQAAAEARKGGA